MEKMKTESQEEAKKLKIGKKWAGRLSMEAKSNLVQSWVLLGLPNFSFRIWLNAFLQCVPLVMMKFAFFIKPMMKYSMRKVCASFKSPPSTV